MKLAVPTIHLNGTSRASLVEDLCEAYSAINAALDKLKRTSPNGRDYYPQGSEAMTAAQDQHQTRMRKLTDVMSEIEQIVEALS